MPNPFIALVGLWFQEKSKRAGGKGRGVAGEKIFSADSSRLFVPTVFVRLAS